MKIQPYIVQIIQAFTQHHKPHKPNLPIEPPAVAALVGAPEARETAGVKLDQRFRPLRLRGSGFRVWGFRDVPYHVSSDPVSMTLYPETLHIRIKLHMFGRWSGYVAGFDSHTHKAGSRGLGFRVYLDPQEPTPF